MLSYDEFKREFEKCFTGMATEDERALVRFSSVTKINEELDSVGLCGEMDHYRGGPCVYLKDYYQDYLEGHEVTEEVASAWDILRKAKGMEISMPDMNWEYIKGHVVLQLISQKGNERYLEGIPHREFLNLAIIYRCIISEKNCSLTSCVITQGMLKMLGVSEEELYTAAYQLTPVLLMPRVFTMKDMMLDLIRTAPREQQSHMEEMLEQTTSLKMWVISSNIRQLGSYLLLYPDIFRGLVPEDEELYIIPSSIHELIAISIPVDESTDSINEMIREVNSSHVAPQERLSDTLYKYEAPSGRVVIA